MLTFVLMMKQLINVSFLFMLINKMLCVLFISGSTVLRVTMETKIWSRSWAEKSEIDRFLNHYQTFYQHWMYTRVLIGSFENLHLIGYLRQTEFLLLPLTDMYQFVIGPLLVFDAQAYLFFLWDYLLINVLILFMFTDGLFVY
jgi:hypothetical protein